MTDDVGAGGHIMSVGLMLVAHQEQKSTNRWVLVTYIHINWFFDHLSWMLYYYVISPYKDGILSVIWSHIFTF